MKGLHILRRSRKIYKIKQIHLYTRVLDMKQILKHFMYIEGKIQLGNGLPGRELRYDTIRCLKGGKAIWNI